MRNCNIWVIRGIACFCGFSLAAICDMCGLFGSPNILDLFR